MEESLRLTIIHREKISKGTMNRMRKEGYLPGSLSQKGGESISFFLKRDEFRKALNANGMSSVYALQLDKKTVYSAMVHEIQHAPGFGDFQHVTFQRVSLTEDTTADIPVHIKGRDELIHKGHELLQQLESIHLKGLPGDFPASIEIDVSNMVPGDQVTVADLKLPKGITSLTESNRLVVSVPHSRLKQEEAPEVEETPVAEQAKPVEGSETK